MISHKTREFAADGALLLAALIWGSTYIIVKGAMAEAPTFYFLFLRFGVAFALLSVICAPRFHRRAPGLLKDGARLGSCLFIVFALQTFALRHASASAVAFITGLYVIFVPILSALMLKKRPHSAAVAGVAMAACGLGLITLDSGWLSLSWGELCALLCSVFCSIHIIWMDPLSRRHDPYLLTLAQIGVVLALSGGLSLWLEADAWPATLSPSLIRAVLITGVLATVLCFLIQTGLQKYTTPTKAALLYAMEPAASVFFGYFIAGELLAPRQSIGAGLILAAMLTAEAGAWAWPRGFRPRPLQRIVGRRRAAETR